jgi:SMEK domain
MALRRQELLNSVTSALAWLGALCKLRGLIHLFDANVVAHDFFCKLLNEVFDLKLVVMDRIKTNFPAIDLGDETNKRSFQITSDKGGDKVQRTIDSYATHNLAEKYGRLSVLVIGEKQVTYDSLTLPGAFTFDQTTDIIDLADLTRIVEALSTEKLERLAEIVRKEIKFEAREAAVSPPQEQIRAMFFPSNPTDGSQMALSIQLRGVKEKLKSPTTRKSVDLVSAWSDHFNGFVEWLQSYQPRVLQLSGCGAKRSDFVLKSPNGTLMTG